MSSIHRSIVLAAAVAAALAATALPARAADGMAKAPAAASTARADIVDTAFAAGQFGTLAKALGAAGLVDTLKGPGPFTVFAPTDAAFARLPAGTVEMLLKPENKAKLASILTYHVVPGAVPASQVVSLDTADTVNGQPVAISSAGGKVKVGNANVTTADVMASNGVIHVIDAVLMPAD